MSENLLVPSLKVNKPYEELIVDEAMIPFKGHLGFKQYMKDKPTNWRVKAFVLSDANNGYIARI